MENPVISPWVFPEIFFPRLLFLAMFDILNRTVYNKWLFHPYLTLLTQWFTGCTLHRLYILNSTAAISFCLFFLIWQFLVFLVFVLFLWYRVSFQKNTGLTKDLYIVVFVSVPIHLVFQITIRFSEYSSCCLTSDCIMSLTPKYWWFVTWIIFYDTICVDIDFHLQLVYLKFIFLMKPCTS